MAIITSATNNFRLNGECNEGEITKENPVPSFACMSFAHIFPSYASMANEPWQMMYVRIFKEKTEGLTSSRCNETIETNHLLRSISSDPNHDLYLHYQMEILPAHLHNSIP